MTAAPLSDRQPPVYATSSAVRRFVAVTHASARFAAVARAIPRLTPAGWIALDKYAQDKPQMVQKTLNALYGLGLATDAVNDAGAYGESTDADTRDAAHSGRAGSESRRNTTGTVAGQLSEAAGATAEIQSRSADFDTDTAAGT